MLGYFFVAFFLSSGSRLVTGLYRLFAISCVVIFFFLNFDVIFRPIVAYNLNDIISTMTYSPYVKEVFEEVLNFLQLSSTTSSIFSNSMFLNLFIFYTLLILFIFFFGNIDRFLVSKSDELEFSILIFFIIIAASLLF
jgi:hypothetical protein